MCLCVLFRGTQVALKKIAKRYTDKSDFQRETDALLRIHDNGGHPNIACLRDMYEDYSHFYLVLDLIRGGEMFDHLIDYGAYSEADAARLMREVASALAFLHGVGIVHADLKPENLMLCSTKREAGTIKVVDFGCARVTHDNFHDNWNDGDRVDASSLESVVKKDSDTTGTTAYWPPEQFITSNDPTPAMDMWSVGVILYIMLTGIHPFDPEGTNTDAQIEERIKKNPHPPIGEYTAHLSPSAIDLIKNLMDPKVKKRIDAYNMLNHPWVRGETASTWVMKGSDKKLAKFKQLRSQVEASIFAALVEASTQEINLSERRRDPLSENVIKSEGHLMKRAFEMFDREGKGVVSVEDLGHGVGKYTGSTISRDDVQEMLDASASRRQRGEDDGAPSGSNLALSDFTELFSKLKYVHTPRGGKFFSAGEPGDCMYFINSGKVEIHTRKGQVVSILRAGEFFGEGSLLEKDNRRFAGARAVTPVDAIKITKEDFDRYTAAPSAHGIAVPLKLKWKTRQLENAKTLIRLEKSVEARDYKKDDIIYSEGEEGDSIYYVNDINGGK
jgi:serine/threonine protein kinase